MDDKLYDLLMKLPKKNLINVVWSALDSMQSYNGRSRTFCVMDSLGVQPNNDMENTWKMPTVKEAKKNTNDMGF